MVASMLNQRRSRGPSGAAVGVAALAFFGGLATVHASPCIYDPTGEMKCGDNPFVDSGPERVSCIDYDNVQDSAILNLWDGTGDWEGPEKQLFPDDPFYQGFLGVSYREEEDDCIAAGDAGLTETRAWAQYSWGSTSCGHIDPTATMVHMFWGPNRAQRMNDACAKLGGAIVRIDSGHALDPATMAAGKNAGTPALEAWDTVNYQDDIFADKLYCWSDDVQVDFTTDNEYATVDNWVDQYDDPMVHGLCSSYKGFYVSGGPVIRITCDLNRDKKDIHTANLDSAMVVHVSNGEPNKNVKIFWSRHTGKKEKNGDSKWPRQGGISIDCEHSIGSATGLGSLKSNGRKNNGPGDINSMVERADEDGNAKFRLTVEDCDTYSFVAVSQPGNAACKMAGPKSAGDFYGQPTDPTKAFQTSTTWRPGQHGGAGNRKKGGTTLAERRKAIHGSSKKVYPKTK